MKYLNIFLFLFAALICLVQKTNEKDTLTISFFEKKENQLRGIKNEVAFEETKMTTCSSIKKNTINKKKGMLIKQISDTHFKTPFFLTQAIDNIRDQYNSDIFHNTYAIKLNAINHYILNSFKSLLSWTHFQRLGDVGEKKYYNNALTFFHLSKSLSSMGYKTVTLIINTGFYISANHFPNSKEVFALFKTKIQSLNTATSKGVSLSYTVTKKNDLKTAKNPIHNTWQIPTKEQTKIDDYQKAYIHLKKATDKKDSIAVAKTKAISDMITDKLTRDNKLAKQKEINKLKAEAAEKEKQMYFFIVITVILASLFFTAWMNSNRKKKRLKLELELQKSKEIISAKNNFLENISHEIKTPITIITGYLSLIKEHTLEPQKIVNYSNKALLNTERMLEAFNDFLTLFRLDKNPTHTQKVSTKNLNLYVKELVSSFTANCELKEISLFYKSNILEKSLIAYDYEALKKIVYNLVSNAVKYSNMNSKIYVSNLLENDSLHILVKDQGIGIDKNEQDAIFKRFYQSKKHTVTDGFGIGLSLVFELVKKMNGSITLESEENVGSEFHITLPLQLHQCSLYIKDQKTTFEQLTENTVRNEPETNNHPKALIVDDNLELISYLEELFSFSLDCTFASNGEEGMSFATKNKYDIIIADIRMPIMDGIEFKSKINALETYKGVPFIMITATPFEALSDLKITLGFDDYIVKPFTKNEIITRVQTLLEKNIYRKKMLAIDDDEINFEGSYSDLTKKMNAVIHENLNNPGFSVKLLAAECGYSQKQLSKIVQSKTGLSLVAIILEVRLLKAYELILKGSHPTLNEVMFAVGINSRTYFSKKFKERFGITPNKLKKQQN